MLIMKSEKNRNNGKKKTAISRKNQNAWRKGKLVENIGSGLDQTSIEERTKSEKNYFRRRRNSLEYKLCGRNLIKGINTWTVLFIRYLRQKKELIQIDQRTRKLITIKKTLHQSDDIVQKRRKRTRQL